MPQKFYQIETEGRIGRIYINGVIGGGVKASDIVPQIDALDVDNIDVFIDSHGGSVDQGWAIYNALKRHPAKITTYNTGFACSIAALIFMAGDKRIASKPSALMIHNASGGAYGTASDHRDLASVLDLVSKEYADVISAHLTISRDELDNMLAKDTWFSPEESLEKGFATSIETTAGAGYSQSALEAIIRALCQEGKEGDPPPEPQEPTPEPPKPEDMTAEKVREIVIAVLKEHDLIKSEPAAQSNFSKIAAAFGVSK